MSLDVYLENLEMTLVAQFSSGVTHNLAKMAQEAGLYQVLWRPEECGITVAKDLIEPLEEGLRILRSSPSRFQKFNPPNGWGNYDGLIEFVEGYLAACRRHPSATVRACR